MMNFLHIVAPDNWVEGVAAIIVSVLSWWLGRRRGERKPRPRKLYRP